MFTAVPYGFTPKFGRFLSGIGYLNDQHQHVWDFFDAPLPYQAFLGGQFKSDGLQLKWVAPTDTFLEFGAEIGDGSSFPGARPQQERHRRAAPRTSTPAATSARATAGARACRTCRLRPSDRAVRADRPRRQSSAARLHRQEPARDRRLRLEVGAQRQRAATRISSCRANISGARRAAISRTTATARSASPTRRATRRARAAGTSRASTSSCRTGASARATTGSIPGSVDYGANGVVPRARRRSIRSAIR